jgi:hypothetical protein
MPQDLSRDLSLGEVSEETQEYAEETEEQKGRAAALERQSEKDSC